MFHLAISRRKQYQIMVIWRILSRRIYVISFYIIFLTPINNGEHWKEHCSLLSASEFPSDLNKSMSGKTAVVPSEILGRVHYICVKMIVPWLWKRVTRWKIKLLFFNIVFRYRWSNLKIDKLQRPWTFEKKKNSNQINGQLAWNRTYIYLQFV